MNETKMDVREMSFATVKKKRCILFIPLSDVS